MATQLWGDWKVEKGKINYLLQEIGQVDGVFIRNGSEYAPEEAVSHLKMKLDNAMSSWFAPNQEDWTAEMFIEKLASESSFSGKPYQIKLHNGQTFLSKDWLAKKLTQYSNSQ